MDKSLCEICMKNDASYRSLWNHNKKFHSNSNNNDTNLNQNSGAKGTNKLLNSVW